jgi:GrpB-like predicted nucleotidyltransferase (UPF0157 family)
VVEARNSGTVQVVEYDPVWPRTFQQLKDQLWPSVCDLSVGIEHVGSTSIPGMAAKPVIDMDIVVAARSSVPSLILRLANLGYEHRGNLGVEDRDAFAAPDHKPAHHLYVCAQNSLALQNHFAVREYLRKHPSEALAYSVLKKQLAARFPHERDQYVKGKTSFIVSLLKKCGLPPEALDSISLSNL